MNPHSGAGLHQVVLDQTLRIGLPEIDQQHSALIDELNRLIADARGPLSTETLGGCAEQPGQRTGRAFPI
jgi:hypothetical protein